MVDGSPLGLVWAVVEWNGTALSLPRTFVFQADFSASPPVDFLFVTIAALTPP